MFLTLIPGSAGTSRRLRAHSARNTQSRRCICDEIAVLKKRNENSMDQINAGDGAFMPARQRLREWLILSAGLAAM